MDTERFGGIARLYGIAAAEALCGKRVAVVGIGGVGSWAAEAAARTGIGSLVLLDMDDLCITNTNRQLPALEGNYGRPKVELMAERIRLINPQAECLPLQSFYTVTNPDILFDTQPDVVIDAIDSMRPKAHLIAECFRRGVPVVTCGGAGGRIDPACIELADLARTGGDNMLAQLRKTLRQQYALPLHDNCPPLGIPCVFSREKPRFPRCDGSVSCEREPGHVGGIGCASGFGSATHITGTFGMMMAGAAVNLLVRTFSLSSHENT